MGRPRTPTALKILDGNRGHRTLNSSEDYMDIITCDPPAWLLNDHARDEWHRLFHRCVKIRLIAETDVTAFSMYCNAVGLMVQAAEAMKGESLLIPGHNGTMKQNPLIKTMTDSYTQVRALATSFGFTPSSKSGMSIMGQEKSNELMELMELNFEDLG